MQANLRHLTSGRLLARNTVLNALGQGAPMVIALFAIPALIHGLGAERFGVLTIVWVAIGYFSLFDFGLGRALTQLVAERLGNRREAEVPALAWTAVSVMMLLGVAGTVVVSLLAPWLVSRLLTVSPALQAETRISFYILACALPLVTGTTGLRGLLEALQRFDLVNALRIPLGVLHYAGPLLVLPFSSSLVLVVGVLALTRAAGWAAHLWLCVRAVPGFGRARGVDRALLSPLLRVGGWMTVSNLISPIMVYLDRFLIGAVLSVTAVAYYATPYEAVTRLWLVPGAVMGVLFPAFALSSDVDRERLAWLFDRAVRVVALLVFPAVLLLVALARETLTLWLGADFALHSARVLRWLAVGVFVNSVAQVPFALLQAAGRADLTGKLHLVELPVYLVMLWVLTQRYGIEGAAAAWTVRASLDALLLFLASARSVVGVSGAVRRLQLHILFPAVGVLAGAAMLDRLSHKYVLVVGLCTLSLLWAWHAVLSDSARRRVGRALAIARE